jgi:hypothetical protein
VPCACNKASPGDTHGRRSSREHSEWDVQARGMVEQAADSQHVTPYRADAEHNRGFSHGGRMLRLASERKAAQKMDGSLQKVTAFSRVCAPWTPRVFLVGPANDVLVGCLPLSSPGSPPAAAKGTVAHLFAPRTLHCTHPNTRQTSAPPKTHSRLCALSSETGPPSPRAAHGSPTLIRRHCIVPPPLARNSSLRSLH